MDPRRALLAFHSLRPTMTRGRQEQQRADNRNQPLDQLKVPHLLYTSVSCLQIIAAGAELSLVTSVCLHSSGDAALRALSRLLTKYITLASDPQKTLRCDVTPRMQERCRLLALSFQGTVTPEQPIRECLRDDPQPQQTEHPRLEGPVPQRERGIMPNPNSSPSTRSQILRGRVAASCEGHDLKSRTGCRGGTVIRHRDHRIHALARRFLGFVREG